MKKVILEVNNLCKYYGKILGVKDISFSLYEGEVFGFIGPNGAGKSTTIRTIMNLLNKSSGSIILDGKELNKDDIRQKELIGYLPSDINLYEDYTVFEMLEFHESFYKKDLKKRKERLIEMFSLDEKKKIKELSFGNLKKLGIVLAFLHEPKLVILDEATSGLDPIMQQKFFNLIKEEKEKGTTIFYSTHILSEISKICDRIGIIKDGYLLKVEEVEQLQNKNLNFVTITSSQIEQIITNLKIEVLDKKDNTIKFKNFLDANTLIKELANYKIDNILIEEATLEDILLHYYK